MDTYIRTNSGSPLITPWSPRGMSEGKYAAVTKADATKREIEADAMKAFDAPQMKVAEKSKHDIRDKIQNIVKRLKILKQLFSGNPKEMARAMTQIFKELKAALKEYKAAVEKEIGGSASAVAATMPADVASAGAASATPPSAEADKPEETKTDTPETEAAPEEATTNAAPTPDETKTPDAAATSAPEDKTALYNSVERKVREMAGEDGLDFLKEVKGVVKYIEEKMLAQARIQKMAQKPDKDTDKVFEDMDKELKDLKKDMDDMERDIKHAVPTIGMHLDIAA